MSDLPRHAVTRSARLVRLPVGYAGRTALGSGKRLGGRPADLVNQEIQQRTADQVFRVLGELKGSENAPRSSRAASVNPPSGDRIVKTIRRTNCLGPQIADTGGNQPRRRLGGEVPRARTQDLPKELPVRHDGRLGRQAFPELPALSPVLVSRIIKGQ